MLRMLLVPLLVVTFAAGCERRPGGTFHVDDELFDFGTIPSSGKDVAIHFRNSGDRPLVVERVSASCRCQAPTVTDRVDPGGEGEIVIHLAGNPGSNATRLTVFSTDPESPHELFVRSFGEYKPRFDPPRLALRARGEVVADQLVRLTYASADAGRGIDIKSIRCVPESYRLVHVKSTPRSAYSQLPAENAPAAIGEELFKFQLQAPYKSSDAVGVCEVVVGQSGVETKLTLPVEIKEEGPVTYGGNLYFSSGSKGLIGATRRVVITVDGSDVTPRVTNAPGVLRTRVTAVPLAARAERAPAAASRRRYYYLEVEVAATATSDRIDSTVDVAVDGLRSGNVSIPVHVHYK